jgi:hypothetical protein
MVTEQFGSPEQKDYIASLERSMTDVVKRTTQHFEETVDRIAPRAIGSTKSSPDDAFQDYLLNIAGSGDPAAAGEEWVKGKASQYGLAKALDMFADMVLSNEERLKGFEAKQPSPQDSSPY